MFRRNDITWFLFAGMFARRISRGNGSFFRLTRARERDCLCLVADPSLYTAWSTDAQKQKEKKKHTQPLKKK